MNASLRSTSPSPVFAKSYLGLEDDSVINGSREEEPRATKFRAVPLSADRIFERLVEVDIAQSFWMRPPNLSLNAPSCAGA